MSLSTALQQRAELHPEPIFEGIPDLVTDIREAAHELYANPTHLDITVEDGYAPRIVEAWTQVDGVAEYHGRLFPARTVWTDSLGALDAGQWIADTFALLVDRDPGEEVLTEMGPGVWRLTLNP